MGPGRLCRAPERGAGAQSHFLDLCELLGVPKPTSGRTADDYVFEQRSLVLGEARGYADVFLRDHFAWENKAPGKNLDATLDQAVTAVYGWADYAADMPDDEILRRLLALNLGRAAAQRT